jgi:hypothetical protein
MGRNNKVLGNLDRGSFVPIKDMRDKMPNKIAPKVAKNNGKNT